MHVAELMRTDVVTIRDDASIADAVVALSDEHISGLPVLNGSRRLVGVFSASDVLSALAENPGAEERGGLFESATVADLMTTLPATITPDVGVKEAAQQMLYLGVHRLFVEEGGELVGVISTSDIVRAVGVGAV